MTISRFRAFEEDVGTVTVQGHNNAGFLPFSSFYTSRADLGRAWSLCRVWVSTAQAEILVLMKHINHGFDSSTLM